MLAAKPAQPHIAQAMRIVCPACQATYEVPDQLIGAGRSLRCKACRHAWHVAPPAPPATATAEPPATTAPESPVRAVPEPAIPAAPPAPPLAPSRPPPPPVPADRPRIPQPIDPPLPHPEDRAPRISLPLRAAWAASILAVGGMLLALWLFRADIMTAWPPAARLYQLLGTVTTG
jgi:predicted Zn finger-like uncharacterized protein